MPAPLPASTVPPLVLERCRSLLFVPAHVRRFVDKAAGSGADAVILDLEDSVPPERKAEARQHLAAAVSHLAAQRLPVLVRVNHDDANAPADLDAALAAGVQALVLPKIDTAAQLARLAARIQGRASFVV